MIYAMIEIITRTCAASNDCEQNALVQYWQKCFFFDFFLVVSSFCGTDNSSKVISSFVAVVDKCILLCSIKSCSLQKT